MKTVKTLTTQTPDKKISGLDNFFEISKRGSNLAAEIRGGIVTFFAMSYILVINPIILSKAAGVNPAAVAAGTALIAGLMTILMGVWANFPLAMAAGMGLNAMVAFTLCGPLNLTYAEAMGLIFWEGVLITILVLTGFREAVFKAIPSQLKVAISVGIGLFIAFIGLVDAGIIRATQAPPVQLGINGSLEGWPALVFVVGLITTIILYVRKVRGAILIGIASSTLLAVIIQMFAHLPGRSAEAPTGWGITIPQLQGSPIAIPSFATLGQIDFFGAFHKLGFVAVLLLVFSLMLADFFDTMGTMVAIGAEAGLLDKEGVPGRSRAILLVDSLSAIAGGLGGVSSNTAYVESSAGVGEGARTGLANIVTGVLFLLSMFFAPVVEIVPSEAATTALVFVGFLMMTQVADIDWKNPEIAIPAFLTIVFMPFSYSITVGIGMGFVSYFFIKLGRGKFRDIHPLMWIVSLLFMLYFVLGPVQQLLGS
ncbi:NCS2 family permease [Actinomycetaceae bacterium TAE3-ERU4]|nr:NCS2 family permease [Actinomycetaceae bacterium TAE3-ERU4]